MKKYILSFCMLALMLTSVQAAPKIKEIESVVSKDELKKSIGLISIDFKILDSTYFNFVIKHTRESVIEDGSLPLAKKNERIAYLETFQNERKNCLVFRIRHDKPVHRQEGGVVIGFFDAKGKPVPYKLLDVTVKTSGAGTLYEQYFLIKPDKKLAKENYTPEEVPLKVIVTFMKTQKKVYSVTPR